MIITNSWVILILYVSSVVCGRAPAEIIIVYDPLHKYGNNDLNGGLSAA